MNDRYETKTYDIASVYLEEGWYTRKELLDIIQSLNAMNHQALAAAEPMEKEK